MSSGWRATLPEALRGVSDVVSAPACSRPLDSQIDAEASLCGQPLANLPVVMGVCHKGPKCRLLRGLRGSGSAVNTSGLAGGPLVNLSSSA